MITITQLTTDTCKLCLAEYTESYGSPSHTEARNYLIQQVMSVYDHNVDGILKAINFMTADKPDESIENLIEEIEGNY
jgi:hypothetical protein